MRSFICWPELLIGVSVVQSFSSNTLSAWESVLRPIEGYLK